MKFVSYAQNDEDILLWRALKSVERGFYIDVGAAIVDGFSVSRAFYEHGWRGVNIEPVPELCEAVRAARPEDVTLCAALGQATGERAFFTIPQTGLSTLDPAIAEVHRKAGWTTVSGRVAVRTLGDVCREYAKGTIHYLKIDVEGAEAEVLAGADFSAFRPWIIVLEATWPGRPEASHVEWEPKLLARGYRFAWFDGLNRFYLAAEQEATLAVHFRTPPNVWDQFERFDAAQAERFAGAQAECRQMEGVLAEKEEEFAAEMAAASAEAFALRRAFFTEREVREALDRRLAESAAEAGRMAEQLAGARRETARLERLAAELGCAETARAPGEAATAPEVVHDLASGEPSGRKRFAPRAALKFVLRPFWRLARPILRPLAWRARGFLLGSIQGTLAELRVEQERLARETAERMSAAENRLAAEFDAAREQLRAESTGALAALLKPIEAALMTVAAAPDTGRPPDQRF